MPFSELVAHLLRAPDQNGKAAGKEVGIFFFYHFFKALGQDGFFHHLLWDFSEGQLVRKSLAVLWKKEFVSKIWKSFLVSQLLTRLDNMIGSGSDKKMKEMPLSKDLSCLIFQFWGLTLLHEKGNIKLKSRQKAFPASSSQKNKI